MVNDCFGLVSSQLLNVLWRVGHVREWTDSDLEKAIGKLHKVGVTTPFKLLLMIRSNLLNPKLKGVGEKAFGKETLKLIVGVIGLGNNSVLLLEDTLTQSVSLLTNCADPVISAPIEVVTELSAASIRVPDVVTPTPEEEELAEASVAAISHSTNTENPPNLKMAGFNLFTTIDHRATWYVVEVPLDWLYFYQFTVAGSFSTGLPLQCTVDELREGKTPYDLPLMYAIVSDGLLYGMGTRRLVCYHYVYGAVKEHTKIPVLMCGHSCDLSNQNPEGMSMTSIGTLFLDGVHYPSVSRRAASTAADAGYILDTYAKKRLAFTHPNSTELFFK